MTTEQDLIVKLTTDRERARTLVQLLEHELNEALETIETLNSRIAGMTGVEAHG
jgi:hypothetical protein